MRNTKLLTLVSPLQRASVLSNCPIDATTPFDIKYETPKNDHPSPCNLRSPGNSLQPPGRWTPAPNPSTARVPHLQLTWQGHSRAEIEAMSQEAYQLEHLGHVEEAEKKYRDALAGLQNLLPQAHEDTSRAAYQLATFYAQHDRMNDADLVLNWMGEEYMKRWGLEHDNTMNHFLNVAELLHNWSRPDDAITILYRVLDKLETESSEDPGDTVGPNVNTATKGQPQVPLTQHTASQSQAEKATGSSTLENQRAFVDYHLGLANLHVRAKDETAEPLLLHLIEQCEAHPEILAEQALHSRCALVKLYRELGKHQQMDTVLDEAKSQLWKHLDSKEKKTKSSLEISLDIARLNVESARYDVAEEIFQRTGCEAEDTFGTDHEITIATFIRIGKIYQSENRWNDAQPWFEQALNASMTANGLESRQTKALEAALENQHYSLPMPQSEDLAALLRCRKLEGDI
jgi:tetratricopeptide (TPR) repeat protein